MRLVLTFVFILAINILQGQDCTGSLGDPIVNVTFGTGSNFGPPLNANTTSNLGYAAATCPNDGFYSIVNYTSGCWANDVVWHTATDHTGDNNGYFMLINASYQPSNFYIQTIDGLCQGTTYQFAAWMLNMCSVTGTLPNITLTIEKTDGSVLGTYNTGDIPIINPVTWKQYGFNFTTPVGISSVVLRMHNNAPGGVGNDVGLDDITFRPIGPAISVNTTFVTGDTATVCSNATQNIELVSSVENCYAVNAYQWQLSTDKGLNWTDIQGATGKAFIRTSTVAGVYMYRLAVSEQNNIGIITCRIASKPFTVIVNETDARTISISTPNNNICENSAVTFTATATFGGATPSYQWLLNGNSVGSNSYIYTSSTLMTGDIVNCVFISSLPCNSSLTSNSIYMTVNKKTDTTISRSICAGSSFDGYSASGTYRDVFTRSSGCDSIRTLNLTVSPKLFSILDTSICYGTVYEGLTNPGKYSYTYTSVNGCDSIHTINLYVLPDISNNSTVDTMLCNGDSIVLSPGPYDNYLWQDGSTKSLFIAGKGGTYSVALTNRCGTTTKKFFVAERACNIVFPSAYTPNNDGLNDVFKILNAYNLTYYHCTIFNRWGQKVFESTDPHNGWDGNIKAGKADIGMYIWLCDYTKAGKPGITHLKGTVTLLR